MRERHWLDQLIDGESLRERLARLLDDWLAHLAETFKDYFTEEEPPR